MLALLFAAALATAETVPADVPATVDTEMQALYDSALASFKDKKWEEAIAPLKTLTAANYRAAETGMALRTAYEQAYGLDGAIAKLEQKVRAEPNDAVAHNSLGVLYLVKNRKDDAQREITAAIQLDPKNLDARSSLAFWYTFVGQSRAAIAEHESILRDHPAAHGSLVELCWLLSDRENDPKRALPHCENALVAKPSDEKLAVTLGLVHMRIGDLDAAEKTFRSAAEANPESQLARQQLGLLTLHRGQPAQAREVFSSILEKNPENVDARVLLARTWQAEKEFAKAAGEYRIAYQKQGGGMLLGALARAYLQQYFYVVVFLLLAAMGVLLWRYLDVKTPDAPAPAV